MHIKIYSLSVTFFCFFMYGMEFNDAPNTNNEIVLEKWNYERTKNRYKKLRENKENLEYDLSFQYLFSKLQDYSFLLNSHILNPTIEKFKILQDFCNNDSNSNKQLHILSEEEKKILTDAIELLINIMKSHDLFYYYEKSTLIRDSLILLITTSNLTNKTVHDFYHKYKEYVAYFLQYLDECDILYREINDYGKNPYFQAKDESSFFNNYDDRCFRLLEIILKKINILQNFLLLPNFNKKNINDILIEKKLSEIQNQTIEIKKSIDEKKMYVENNLIQDTIAEFNFAVLEKTSSLLITIIDVAKSLCIKHSSIIANTGQSIKNNENDDAAIFENFKTVFVNFVKNTLIKSIPKDSLLLNDEIDQVINEVIKQNIYFVDFVDYVDCINNNFKIFFTELKKKFIEKKINPLLKDLPEAAIERRVEKYFNKDNNMLRENKFKRLQKDATVYRLIYNFISSHQENLTKYDFNVITFFKQVRYILAECKYNEASIRVFCGIYFLSHIRKCIQKVKIDFGMTDDLIKGSKIEYLFNQKNYEHNTNKFLADVAFLMKINNYPELLTEAIEKNPSLRKIIRKDYDTNPTILNSKKNFKHYLYGQITLKAYTQWAKENDLLSSNFFPLSKFELKNHLLTGSLHFIPKKINDNPISLRQLTTQYNHYIQHKERYKRQEGLFTLWHKKLLLEQIFNKKITECPSSVSSTDWAPIMDGKMFMQIPVSKK